MSAPFDREQHLGGEMAIRMVVRDEEFTPDEVDILISAFEITLREASFVHREDPLTLMIAKEIVAIATDGERDPQKLSASALDALGLRWDDAA